MLVAFATTFVSTFLVGVSDRYSVAVTLRVANSVMIKYR